MEFLSNYSFLYLFIELQVSIYILSSLKGPNQNIRVIQIKATWFEDKLMKLNRITQFLNHPFPAIYLHLFLPYRTRRLFRSTDYKYVISVSLYSLYWVYKTDPSTLGKLIHYSLEIEKVTDPHVRMHWKLVPLLKMELLILKKIKGLIIQDQMRLDAFLNPDEYAGLHIFYLPVSIPEMLLHPGATTFTINLNYFRGKKLSSTSELSTRKKN